MPLPPIDFRVTDISDIELIRMLWLQLNEHHHGGARAFRSHYEKTTFDDRKAYFEKVAGNGTLRIDLAYDTKENRCIGYCVSSLSAEKTGEIESVFIEQAYRSKGIGTGLVARAIRWLDGNDSVRNRVSVADGNEKSFPFYRKFGFHPRMTVLEQVHE
jgi:GNAT superfamily N-acetyltransferase